MGIKIKFKTEKEIEEMLTKEALRLVKKYQAKEKEENNGVQSTVEKPVG